MYFPDRALQLRYLDIRKELWRLNILLHPGRDRSGNVRLNTRLTDLERSLTLAASGPRSVPSEQKWWGFVLCPLLCQLYG